MECFIYSGYLDSKPIKELIQMIICKKKLLGIITLTWFLSFYPNTGLASTNYYYSNGQRISIEEIPNIRVYRLPTNKEKVVDLKSCFLKQIHPKSYYYKLDKAVENKDLIEKYFRLFNNKPIQLPVYKETNTGEELIITDDYLVSFNNSLSDKEIKEIIDKELNSEIIELLHYVLDGKGYFLRIREPNDNVVELSNKCIEEGWCNWAQPNFVRKTYLNSTPSDSYYIQQWHLQNVDSAQAWDITKGSTNITVAIIDDGVDWFHEEFATPGKITKKYNLVENNNDPSLAGTGDNTEKGLNVLLNLLGEKNFSHGTSVAGLAAASENGIGVVGVCPNCMLLPIRFLTSEISVGTIVSLTTSDKNSSEAIRKAVDEGADVINNSWSIGSFLPDIVRSAIDYAHSKGRNGKGSIVVFSAGNGSMTSCQTSPVYSPGNYLPVIAVGATDRNDNVTCYSSTGPELDVVAPGGTLEGDIVTTDLVGPLGYSPKNAFDTFTLSAVAFGGNWQLDLFDLFSKDQGVLNSWSLDFVDINNQSYKYESSAMFLGIPDGLGITTSFPGPILTTTVLPNLPSSGVPLIKDIYFNLDITHSYAYDIVPIITNPIGGNVDIRQKFPGFFPESPFIPINRANVYHTDNLPSFELDNKGNYTNSFNGTSAAAPIVSGLVGLILSVNPNLTYKQVDQILKETADKVDPSFANYKNNGHSDTYGFGRINAFKAVQKASNNTIVGIDNSNPATGNASEIEPNNGVATANEIKLPVNIQGNASQSDSGDLQIDLGAGDVVVLHDLFKFTLSMSSKIAINLDNKSSADLELFLLDGQASQTIAQSTNAPGNDERIDIQLNTGTYLVAVGALTGAGSYSLSIKENTSLGTDTSPPVVPSGNNESDLTVDGIDSLNASANFKRYKVRLTISGTNLRSITSCSAYSKIGGLGVRIKPADFTLSPQASSKAINVIIPISRNLKQLGKVDINIDCDNGTSQVKTITLK
jgi:subtilisin family serine protease